MRGIPRFFSDFHREGPEATFVSPVRLGLPEQSRSYGQDPWYQPYIDTPLRELPNRIVILNEVFLHKLLRNRELTARLGRDEDRHCIPHVHAVLCRSQVEARHCRSAYRDALDVHLIGDLFLDEVPWPRPYRRKIESVAFLTSTHRIDATATIGRMLDDLADV